MTDVQVRGWLALISGTVFFGVIAVIMIPAGLGLTDFDVAKEALTIWGSVAGPLTGLVFGYFFGKPRNTAPTV